MNLIRGQISTDWIRKELPLLILEIKIKIPCIFKFPEYISNPCYFNWGHGFEGMFFKVCAHYKNKCRTYHRFDLCKNHRSNLPLCVFFWLNCDARGGGGACRGGWSRKKHTVWFLILAIIDLITSTRWTIANIHRIPIDMIEFLVF